MAVSVKDVQRVVDMILHNKVTEAIKEIALYAIIAWVMFITTNPAFVNKLLNSQKEKDHAALVEKRLKVDPQVRSLLKEVIYETGADRAFVCEFHNGTNNFTGLPFIYLDMKYEELRNDSLNHIDDEYINFNMTRYAFIPYVVTRGCWFGSVEDIEDIDPRFATHIRRENGDYMAFFVINSVETPIGIIGIGFEDRNTRRLTEAERYAKMFEVSQKLSILLSAD